MPAIYLEIDASDLDKEISRLRDVMTPEQFERAMYGIFNKTGGHVRRILREDLPHKYYAKGGEISSAVGGAKVTTGAGGVGCAIPIRDTRKNIGSARHSFSATGGAHGWKSLKRKYRVKAKVVKDGVSVLPANASSYGGQPPFRNYSASKLNNLAFTREGKSRLPIRKMEGIAIPQMPMNRSEPEVQKDIKVYLEREMERRFNALLMTGR